MDNGTGVVTEQLGGWRSVSRYQWFVFLVVWLGWTLDAGDFSLYALVLRPALTELLGGNPALAQIGSTGGILSMMGLLGWAFGGFIFGILADYIGRVRALAFSILLYSVFTALQGFSHGIWDFAVYRFIAGLGTGAELMVGIPLLAEVLGESHRAKIAGCMMPPPPPPSPPPAFSHRPIPVTHIPSQRAAAGRSFRDGYESNIGGSSIASPDCPARPRVMLGAADYRLFPAHPRTDRAPCPVDACCGHAAIMPPARSVAAGRQSYATHHAMVGHVH